MRSRQLFVPRTAHAIGARMTALIKRAMNVVMLVWCDRRPSRGGRFFAVRRPRVNSLLFAVKFAVMPVVDVLVAIGRAADLEPFCFRPKNGGARCRHAGMIEPTARSFLYVAACGIRPAIGAEIGR
jgi:hypothetical protein